ncbi:MAG: Mur ligase domain-containing protein [Leptospiraceae bacterium]|nr:Mur ligase domain-containing protein [Leptospiraceae bacterium]
MRKIHLIGGGGVGMSSLGLYLLHRGYTVSASDQEETKYLKLLKNAGAQVWVGHDPKKIPQDAFVYYSSAISVDNPERLFCEQKGIPCLSRHHLLEMITQECYTIAVAGTHGKTTTTAWIGSLLEDLGYDPTVIVGGSLSRWQGNFRGGRGLYDKKPLLVLEADESDGSFLYLDYRIAVLTNTDWDHPDRFPTRQDVEHEYLTFLKKNPQAIIVCSLESQDFFRKHKLRLPASLEKISIKESHGRSQLFYENNEIPISLPGKHNLYNASAVLACLLHFSSAEKIIPRMSFFTGVERRLQKIGVLSLPQGVIDIIDDYAHHPSELRASYKALQDNYHQVLLAWEPHRLSRLSLFGQDFLHFFEEENILPQVVLLPLYTAGEKEVDYPQSKKILERIKQKIPHHLDFFSAARLYDYALQILTKFPAAILFAGAGKSQQYAYEFLNFMSER